MLTTDTIGKAIELFERGSDDSSVAEATGISPEQARAIAKALYFGETDRLFREVGLADVLEAAAQALRSGEGLVGDTAADVVREIWHCYPGAAMNSEK
jgi:MoxR-like ATPase